MKILLYSSKDFEKTYLNNENKEQDELVFKKERLSSETASAAKGFEAISIFVNDDTSAAVLEKLHEAGVKIIAIRAAGYDNVDIAKANELGMVVTNVPSYSPHAIAEHAVALLLALDRKLILADRQGHKYDFRIDNLVGYTVHRKTVGVIGVGTIGKVFTKIMHGFGCNLLGYDICEDKAMIEKYGMKYVPLDQLCREADIISLHTPLTPDTKHMINSKLIATMKDGVVLINTSRGGVVNTVDVLDALKSGKMGGFGADVYEGEKGLFFLDHSKEPPHDPELASLLAMDNVIVTPHQAFATAEALTNICTSVFKSIHSWKRELHVHQELTKTGVKNPSASTA
jgi:D-lactate dehydrogenase